MAQIINDLKDSFEKEVSKVFEIGFKSNYLKTLALNGAIYITDTEDMQDLLFCWTVWILRV